MAPTAITSTLPTTARRPAASVQAPATAPTPISELAADIHGDQVCVYARGDDGQLIDSKQGKTGSAAAHGAFQGLKHVFFPSNLNTSVSKDYLDTRKWIFVRDMCANAGGFCAGAAIASALGVDPNWGGAAMATFNLIRDRVCQVTNFGTSFATPNADKNPRAWMLRGEVLEHVGTVADSMVALAPGALFPLVVGVAAMRTAAGTMKGAATANIDPRQAIADNLGELRAKNGNQGFVSSLIGAGIGLAANHALTAALGAAASPILCAVAATGAAFSMSRMIANLDYYPINEDAVRHIVDRQETAHETVGPEKGKVWGTLLDFSKDKYQLGQDVRPLLEDPARFAELEKSYAGRNYILEAREGQPYVVLKEGCTSEDRFQAVYQAVHFDRLKGSPEYQQKTEQVGQPKADLWAVGESLSRTPADVKPMLAQLKQAGWSTDMLRFQDTGNRARWGA